MAALTLPMVAARLACPVTTARKLVVARKIRGYKLGIQWRVESEDLEAFIDERRAATANRVVPSVQGLKEQGAFIVPRYRRR